MGLSVYVSFFRDYDYLERVLSQVVGFASEIILVDGANFPTLPGFATVGIEVDKKSLTKLFEEKAQFLADWKTKYNIDVKYHWGIWETERAKRMYAYSCCKNELVMTLDADEIIDFKPDFIDRFTSSEAVVAGVDCLNMYTSDVFLGGDFYNYTDNTSQKNILFKNKQIDAERHLDYLWLVNHKAEKFNQADLYNGRSLGTMYHATSMRSSEGKLIKNIFYQSFGKEDVAISELAKWSSQLARINQNEISLRHATNGLIGFPLERKFYQDPSPATRRSDIIEYIENSYSSLTAEESILISERALAAGEYWVRTCRDEENGKYVLTFQVSNENLSLSKVNIYAVRNAEKPRVITDSEFEIELKDNEYRILVEAETIVAPVIHFVVSQVS